MGGVTGAESGYSVISGGGASAPAFEAARLWSEQREGCGRGRHRGQGPRTIGPLRETDCFIRVEKDASGFEIGAVVRVLPLRLDGSWRCPHRRQLRARPT